MKYRFSVLAAALATALVTILAPAARSGVVLEDLPAPGSQFRKTAFLEQDVLAEGGKRLTKGSYEVLVESLGRGKVRATFLQGGVKKGEANGIIIIGGSQAADPNKIPAPAPGGRRATFNDLGLGAATPLRFVKGAGKLDLVIGGEGLNRIQIGLLLPAITKIP